MRSDCVANFVDVRTTALCFGQMLSSVNLVRSWAIFGLIGSGRKLMTGFVRHATTTDMQVSRLSDEERCRPWDLLVKVGTEATLTQCKQALTKDGRSLGVSRPMSTDQLFVRGLKVWRLAINRSGSPGEQVLLPFRLLMMNRSLLLLCKEYDPVSRSMGLFVESQKPYHRLVG